MENKVLTIQFLKKRYKDYYNRYIFHASTFVEYIFKKGNTGIKHFDSGYQIALACTNLYSQWQDMRALVPLQECLFKILFIFENVNNGIYLFEWSSITQFSVLTGYFYIISCDALDDYTVDGVL